VASCVEAGLAGLECLSGIPGSVGATPIQNVGAYGQEVADSITSVRVLDRQNGEVVALPAEECGFRYRSSRFRGSQRWLVLTVEFSLVPAQASMPIRYAELARRLGVQPGESAPLAAVREAVLELRRSKGMVVDAADPDSVSAGSFFTNPILDPEAFAALERRVAERLGPGVRPPGFPEADGRVKTSAAWLIERAGFARGYGDGAAGISAKHTLALVNRGGATAAQLLAVARQIAAGVRERFGVELRPEPVFVGHSWEVGEGDSGRVEGGDRPGEAQSS
jgi:UDP-N-acetylmuramate dehydrogenase